MDKKIGVFVDERLRQLFDLLMKNMAVEGVNVVEIQECVCQHNGNLENFSFTVSHPPCLDGSVCPYSSIGESLSFENFIDSHPTTPFYVFAIMWRDIYDSLNKRKNCHVIRYGEGDRGIDDPLSFHGRHLGKKMNSSS